MPIVSQRKTTDQWSIPSPSALTWPEGHVDALERFTEDGSLTRALNANPELTGASCFASDRVTWTASSEGLTGTATGVRDQSDEAVLNGVLAFLRIREIAVQTDAIVRIERSPIDDSLSFSLGWGEVDGNVLHASLDSYAGMRWLASRTKPLGLTWSIDGGASLVATVWESPLTARVTPHPRSPVRDLAKAINGLPISEHFDPNQLTSTLLDIKAYLLFGDDYSLATRRDVDVRKETYSPSTYEGDMRLRVHRAQRGLLPPLNNVFELWSTARCLTDPPTDPRVTPHIEVSDGYDGTQRVTITAVVWSGMLSPGLGLKVARDQRLVDAVSCNESKVRHGVDTYISQCGFYDREFFGEEFIGVLKKELGDPSRYSLVCPSVDDPNKPVELHISASIGNRFAPLMEFNKPATPGDAWGRSRGVTFSPDKIVFGRALLCNFLAADEHGG